MVNVWSVKEGEVYGGQYVVSEGIRDLRSTPPSLTEDFDFENNVALLSRRHCPYVQSKRSLSRTSTAG